MSKWKSGVYVEDSTKGRALTLPRKYKGDTLVQLWADRRKLAALAQYYDSKRLPLRYMSDLLRHTIDLVYDTLAVKGDVKEMTVQQATDYLQWLFRIEMNPQNRGRRNVQHNMILEQEQMELALRYRTPEALRSRQRTVSEECVNSEVVCENKLVEMVKSQVEKPIEAEKGKHRFNPEFCDENGNLDMEKVKASRAKNALAQNAVVEQMKRNRAQALLNEQEERERLKALRSEQKIKEKIEVLKAKLGKESDQPRAKTEEEIEEDYKRIESKDRALLAALDAPAPKPTDD